MRNEIKTHNFWLKLGHSNFLFLLKMAKCHFQIANKSIITQHSERGLSCLNLWYLVGYPDCWVRVNTIVSQKNVF